MKKFLKIIAIILCIIIALIGGTLYYFRGQIGFYINVYKEYPILKDKLQSVAVSSNTDMNKMIDAKEVVYKKDKEKDVTLDIYEARKKLKNGTPVILYVHGGSWIYGNASIPTFMEPILDIFRNEGFTIISVNYTKDTKEIDFETQVSDVKDAIRWVNKNAKEYGFNKNETGIIGASAGAQLSLMAAYTDNNMFNSYEPLKDYSSKVKWVVDLFGPTDLKGLNMNIAKGDLKKAIDKREQNLNGRNNINEYMEEYSPINYVKKGMPSTLIIHGEEDKMVPFKDSEELYKKLEESGNNAKLLNLQNCGHDLRNIDKEQMMELSIKFVNFIIFNTDLR
ncbi:MAG: alpha/beta hydrolase fold domain-containing protein [Clostridium sp.]|uniref:alpha/beta hydrolase fold domain-containing protein n=1 Tax=Clostridium sp. TaxID=1506 RepID=UPI003F329A1F